MGYPMTFRRLINRNDLRGDYGDKLSLWNVVGMRKTYGYDKNDGTNLGGLMFTELCDEIDKINNRWGLVQGDLRRLERDAVDESAICKIVAQRSGVDVEIVAVVLKEFMDL